MGDIDRQEPFEERFESSHEEGIEDNSSTKNTCEPKPEEIMDSLEALRDLRCLVGFINLDLKPTVDELRDDSCQNIRFEDLWHIFQPGVEIYSPQGKNRVFLSA